MTNLFLYTLRWHSTVLFVVIEKLCQKSETPQTIYFRNVISSFSPQENRVSDLLFIHALNLGMF